MSQINYKEIYDLVDNRTQEINKKLDDMTNRISSLEQWRANLLGKFSIVAALVGIFSALLVDSIRKKLNL